MSLKDAYQQKVQAQLDLWKADIDTLEAKADRAEADVRIKYYEQIEDLRSKQTAAREKLKELQRAGEGAWMDLKSGVESAWHELETAVKSATSKFK